MVIRPIARSENPIQNPVASNNTSNTISPTARVISMLNALSDTNLSL
jgi:hypothetical protein